MVEAMRPQFGSSPKIAVLTSGELLSAFAAVRARDGALTVMVVS